MVKFRALQDFKGIKENRVFKKGDEFDMTVARAEEVQRNINLVEPTYGAVMERTEPESNADEETKEVEETKPKGKTTGEAK